jgi:very-short-patch-repair endonuclease
VSTSLRSAPEFRRDLRRDATDAEREARDLALHAMGVRTLRYSNLDVLKETEGVAEAIWDEIHRITVRE